MIEYRNVRVALLGGGTVGAQVARLLLEHRAAPTCLKNSSPPTPSP
jgi:homoserine dehydrogenase